MNPLKLNTTSVSLAVTPTIVSTFLSHFLNKKIPRENPAAHLSYDEGLHLIRTFLQFASHHPVEELQAFTSQWVPHPQWVRVDDFLIPQEHVDKAAGLLRDQLGEDGVRRVGGTKWWQWRKPDTPLKAEWIEMKADYQERKASGGKGKRVMLYVHGGGYFFGSVDEHRYQMQRHARKLKARVFAPKYRLAPQFPFPCGLHDCISAYLYLLTVQEPSEIVLAGDSAGGGMVVAMLCALRDQGIPLPAGAILISPWVDLTHSFPSVAAGSKFDYIPDVGFHHKPSRAWPPPNEDDLAMLKKQAEKLNAGHKKAVKTATLEAKQASAFKMQSQDGNANAASDEVPLPGSRDPPPSAAPPDPAVAPRTSILLSVTIDGKLTTVKDQIQMYATNDLLFHPLVSPVMQPTLGGLPPLLIMVGGGEILRDEQIFLAHKCANPVKYALPAETMTEIDKERLKQYKPTDVQLQVWDDLCHVAPTLSFTKPAKYMYRSIAQFGAWALARAQRAEIEILDDDDISVITGSGSDDEDDGNDVDKEGNQPDASSQNQIGKAGDTLPPFKAHMIRQRVSPKGVVYALALESELPACTMDLRQVGVAKETPVRRWLETKKHFADRYASALASVHKQIVKDMAAGFIGFGEGEDPPPTALAGRRRAGDAQEPKKKKSKGLGMALWSLWGSKHDEMTLEREKKADQTSEEQAPKAKDGASVRSAENGDDPSSTNPMSPALDVVRRSRSRSRRRTVVDEHQTSQPRSQGTHENETPVAELIEIRKQAEERSGRFGGFLSPGYVPETGIAGKRPHLEGIALPFSLGKDADTASMMTLQSTAGPDAARPISPMGPVHSADVDMGPATPLSIDETTHAALDGGPSVYATPAVELTRPQMERDVFVTATEDLPLANGKSEQKRAEGPGVSNGAL